MSRTGDPGRFEPCDCDPEKVFELADGGSGLEGLHPEQDRELREHLACCSVCRELYERELGLNAWLSSLDFSGMGSGSVAQGVAMALPTRSTRARVFWGLLAGALLVLAFVSLKFNGTEPVILLISALGAGWGFVAGSAKVAHSVFATFGPTILLALALGALADLLIALLIFSANRNRRAREA